MAILHIFGKLLEHIYIFVRKTRSENRHRKHNVVTMLVFGCSNEVGNTMLRQRCESVIRRRDQNTTKT